mmetsp:Transcript_11028/g.18505  ORF Transcript_11028/g.18505 Transcript_11028/m.18505 type:complete len:256 (-) Transcript_11028:15-782(-)
MAYYLLYTQFVIILVYIVSVAETYAIKSVINLTKVYTGSWFTHDRNALSNLQLDFPRGKIIAFVGPSGSGKSTLGKVIAGLESITSGSIESLSPSELSCAYIDDRFYMTYDDQKTVIDTLNGLKISEYSKEIFPAILNRLEIDATQCVRNLLESQRKIVEILLALGRTAPASPPYLLILDEYLDKDLTAVRTKVINSLRALGNDPKLQLQVMIITHSKSVLQDCTDYAFALRNGHLFSEGNPSKLSTPGQINWLA